MKTLPLSGVKMKLSGLVDLVNCTGEEIVITKNGCPAAVLVSPEEFESWKETIAVRSDSALMKEIQGVEGTTDEKGQCLPLKELFP